MFYATAISFTSQTVNRSNINVKDIPINQRS